MKMSNLFEFIRNRFGLEQEEKEPGLYDRTVDEQIEHYGVYCDTHGELSPDDVGLTHKGKLVCTGCSLNQEMDVRNEHDIDATVEVGDYE